MSDPAVAVGTEACYDSVIPGVHMNGNEGAYLQVTSPQALYDFYFGFQATIVFRTTERDATLVIIYQSNNAYMLLDIYNGVVSYSHSLLHIMDNLIESFQDTIMFLDLFYMILSTKCNKITSVKFEQNSMSTYNISLIKYVIRHLVSNSNV